MKESLNKRRQTVREYMRNHVRTYPMYRDIPFTGGRVLEVRQQGDILIQKISSVNPEGCLYYLQADPFDVVCRKKDVDECYQQLIADLAEHVLTTLST